MGASLPYLVGKSSASFTYPHSSLYTSTLTRICQIPYGFAMPSRRAVAQLARVPVSNTGGWGFKSLLPCSKKRRSRHELTKGKNMTDAVENGEQKLNIFARAGLFYRQVTNELRKVVWPTRKQLTTYTAVVLVFVSFVIAVVSLFDLVITKVVFWVFG
jgi:preprotein translocase subunit SecE